MLGFSGTREWVYPQSIKGKFTTLRRWAFLALHLILFVTPWIGVGGHPLLLIDIPARQVFLFGAIYTASDSFFFLLLLLFLAFLEHETLNERRRWGHINPFNVPSVVPIASLLSGGSSVEI